MNNKDFEYCFQFYVDNTVQWKKLADELGYESGEKLRSQFKDERKKRGIPSKKDSDANGNGQQGEGDLQRERTSFSETDESIHVICDSPRIRSKNDVIQHFNIDMDVWEVTEFTIRTSEGYRKDKKVQWEVQSGVVVSGSVDDSGKMLIVPMIHTETKFARKPFAITTNDIEEFFNNYVPNRGSYSSEIRQYKSGGLVLEIDLADVHVGNESVPFDVLKSRIINLVEDIKRRSKGLVFEKIYLVQLGDILHFDNYGRQTTSGTHVTYGTSFHTMFQNAMDLYIWVIEELSKISKVEVINIYGNHDKINSFTLAKTVEAYFRNNENIVIDATPDIRKFRKIGISSVAFIHGDMPKTNIHDTFQKEARKLFGETIYSEIHLGHLHHEISFEKSGVIIRYLPSITIPDEWHRGSGYTGAKQGTHCFVWDQEKGLSDIWMIPCGEIK